MSTLDDNFQDDDILIFEDDSVDEENISKPWKVLFVDDDEDVLLVTQLALSNLTVSGVPIQMLQSTSVNSAKSILNAHPDIAVLVTDIAMNSEYTGFDLIEWTLQQSVLDGMRLVIRTGEAEPFNSEDIFQQYTIHDLWLKTDITVQRMRIILIGLIRSYSDISKLKDRSV